MRLLLALTMTLLVPASVAQGLTYEGRVVAAGDPVEVVLDDSLDVPRGAVAYSFESTRVGQREVGVLTGSFRVLRAEARRLYLAPSEFVSGYDVRVGSHVGVGDRIQIAFPGPPGFVTISSEPAAARLVWQGEELGTTPLTKLRLAPGSYAFVLEAPGYRPQALPVEVPSGRLVVVTSELSPFPKARTYFEEAERLYNAHVFAEALATLDSVDLFVDDGSIQDAIRRKLPVLRDLVRESLGLVERNAEASEDTMRRAIVAYRLYRRNVDGGDPRALMEGVDRLHSLLPSDPLARRLYVEHRLPAESTGGRH